MGFLPVIQSYIKRFSRTILGLFLYGLGIQLAVQANVGLAAWETFSVGLSRVTGIGFGDMVVLSGLLILLIDIALREKLGFGTILNALLIGKFVDLIAWMDLIPLVENFALGIGILLLSQVVVAFASFVYIGGGLGCGPRDGLMVALGKRLPKVPIGVVRGLIEGSVLLVGWLLGARVGVGTVIAVFGISFIIQGVFHLMRFDVKAVRHESIVETVNKMRGKSVS